MKIEGRLWTFCVSFKELHSLSKARLQDLPDFGITALPCKGASIYEVRSGWGRGRGQQICDKGGGGQKIRKFCGRHIWKALNSEEEVVEGNHDALIEICASFAQSSPKN